MYRPLPAKASPAIGFSNSMMPKMGINREAFSQVMGFDFAISLINYIPHPYGLEIRKGIKAAFERAGSIGITLLQEFTEGVWIVGYGTKVEAYNESTEAWTTIKSDFTSGTFDGDRYGEYFFVTNGIEKIHRINSSLAITEVSAAPISTGLKAIGPRLYAWFGDLITYSEVDDGSDPPFDDWTQTTAADMGGTVRFKNGKNVRAVLPLGPYIVSYYDEGQAAFFINTIDSAGTLKKLEVIQDYTEDFGGATGAISTADGIYFVNEAGLWITLNVGSTDTPKSKQQGVVSVNLGNEYFEGVDQTKVDMIYDQNQRCVFVTLAKNSTANNLVIGYKPEMKAMFEFRGWNISKFAKSGQKIYGASSVKPTVYEMFEGYDDDGLAIGTEVIQEVPLKTLFHAHSLTEFYAGGALSPASVIKVAFNIYDLEGKCRTEKATMTWTPQYQKGNSDGWVSAIWGQSQWGGGVNLSGLVECFDGGSVKINNFQRLLCKTTSSSKSRHILYWNAFKTIRKQPIKRRHITLN